MTLPLPNPPGPLWQLEARKYDHSLHYTLPARLVEDNGVRLWFRTEIGCLLRHVTRGWTRPMLYASDMIFWRDAWYNVYVNTRPDRTLDHFYCNVSLPPVIAGRTLSFVDLDLDVQIERDGQYIVLDEDEFAAHAVQYNYPADVQRRARQAVEDILALWRARGFPFDFDHGPA